MSLILGVRDRERNNLGEKTRGGNGRGKKAEGKKAEGKKKLSKKELRALQEQKEKERAEELERTFRLYHFPSDRWQNIMALPLPHQDVVLRFTGLYDGKPMTVGEIAEKIDKEIHYPLSSAHVEAILSDALEMTEFSPDVIPERDRKITTVAGLSERGFERLCEEVEQEGCKALVRFHYMLEKKGKKEKKIKDTGFLVSSKEGFQSLQEIREKSREHFFGFVDYDYAMEHRKGLMTEMRFGWQDADSLIALSEDEEQLRDALRERYQDVDIVRFPSIIYLYDLAGSDKYEYRQETPAALMERIRLRKETARKCAVLLEEMGKPVIRGFDLSRLPLSTSYEFAYLGRDLARKAISDTPNRLAKTLPDFDLDGPEMQSLKLRDEGLPCMEAFRRSRSQGSASRNR